MSGGAIEKGARLISSYHWKQTTGWHLLLSVAQSLFLLFHAQNGNPNIGNATSRVHNTFKNYFSAL